MSERQRRAVVHVGPTNSGKTYEALKLLAGAKHGAYLAPLRLLAWEVYDRLNNEGCPTDLLTGEEVQKVPLARVTSATVEMFPRRRYEVVVVDEAQLVGDESRGWAWTRALLGADTDDLQVCCSPEGEGIVTRLLADNGDAVEVQRHERLVPLQSEEEAVGLGSLPDSSAVVAFSRLKVLRLKAEIERLHPRKRCAVIYGSLPPDVRKAQARLVLDGICDFVAATDAIGMGMNLPIDHVFFYESIKFDGVSERRLTASEVRQISGRAGRFGMSDRGTFGGTSPEVHFGITNTALRNPVNVERAYLKPEYADIERFDGRLAKRIARWKAETVPAKSYISVAPLEEMIELAELLPQKVETEDRPRAFRLVSAPVAEETMTYWLRCVKSRSLPHPTDFTNEVKDDYQLDRAEQELHEHELCLWLSRLGSFARLPDLQSVKLHRNLIAEKIHLAISSSIVFGKCLECGRRMNPSNKFRICGECHTERVSGWEEEFDEEFER